MSRSGLTEVVLAVVDARPDPTTEHFDAELAAAVADGRCDAATARTLRWWQRESVRGVHAYLADALPPILEALDKAAGGMAAAVGESVEAWATARDTTAQEPVTAPSGASRPVASPSARDRLADRRRELVAGLVGTEPPLPPPNNGHQQAGRPGPDKGRR